MPTFKYIHPQFKFRGIHFNKEGLLELAYNFVKEGKPYQQSIGRFLLDWLNPDFTIKLQTSGSTGKPKLVEMEKQAMVNSALATGTFFGLQPDYKTLLCLPTHYIAGKMMLVRAMVLGLELDDIEPSTQLKIDTATKYKFSAMVPIQLEKSLSNCDNIETIIVGGAAVSEVLKNQLKHLKTNVYETYGMTETVSHIALKKLNNFKTSKVKPQVFKVLPNIFISLDDRNCLVVEAPQLSKDKIITNDVVKLHSKTEFEWLGRFDNVINSGGIKLFPEQIEAKLQHKISTRFFIASQPDTIFGEKLILVVENSENNIKNHVFSVLEKFEKPKVVYNVEAFVETPSGKIKRKETLKKVLKAL
ncbi:MAG: AMP-binding protein [Aestuariibaculum sp.]